MIIRKQYNVEMGHLVRNCSSERCAWSQHGHSAIIEVMLSGMHLDNAGMLYDFGLMKGTIKQFIDSFDHCYVFWNKESNEFKDYVKKFNHRWIEVDFNPTAENLAIFYHGWIEYILQHTIKKNNEDSKLHVHSIKYHETATGYAQTEPGDITLIFETLDRLKPMLNIENISPDVVKDWSEDLKKILYDQEHIENPDPFKQV